MHIEPGIVTGTKLAMGYATAVGSMGLAAKFILNTLNTDGVVALAVRSLITTVLAFSFFQLLPNYPVGVSEVHFILGSTLFLIFGAGPAAIGLALGLLAQGMLVAPWDLPQYGMNVTTLLAPLFAVSVLARRVIAQKTAYKDLTYAQALALSTAYQGGVVAWVAFWAFYGSGFGMETVVSVATFVAAYSVVIVVEPLIDLSILTGAKTLHHLQDSKAFNPRIYQAGA